jgi:hypothetical protein
LIAESTEGSAEKREGIPERRPFDFDVVFLGWLVRSLL